LKVSINSVSPNGDEYEYVIEEDAEEDIDCRGVFPLLNSTKIVCSGDVEVDLDELPKWKPNVVIDNYRFNEDKIMTLLYELIENQYIEHFEKITYIIREKLIEGQITFDSDDLSGLESIMSKLSPSYVVALLNVVEVLLEKPTSEKSAVRIIQSSLHHSDAEVRYAALEAIEYGLGSVDIARTLWEYAQNVLKNDSNSIIKEYLKIF